MGVMDKFLNAMRLNVDDEEYYDDDDFYDDEVDYDDVDYDEPRRPAVKRTTRASKPEREPAPSRPRTTERTTSRQTSAKITPMRSSRRSSGDIAMEVCVIKPKSVEDAREITETLLQSRTVVLNLEGIDLEIGQRIIDFTAGSCYAIDGKLQKISNYIFIATPPNVDISGDFQSLVDSFDVSSIQMDI